VKKKIRSKIVGEVIKMVGEGKPVMVKTKHIKNITRQSKQTSEGTVKRKIFITLQHI